MCPGGAAKPVKRRKLRRPAAVTLRPRGRIAQGVLEWTEVAPIVPPAPAGSVEKWTAYLGCARGMDRAFGLVKTQAVGVPRNPAVGEHQARSLLQVDEHVFVTNLQYRVVWQHATPMRHQLCVPAIVASQLAEVVAEVLIPREQLRIAGEASVARISHHVDDARTRERHLDQSKEQEVGWQLVGDAFRRRGPGSLALDIGFAQRP